MVAVVENIFCQCYPQGQSIYGLYGGNTSAGSASLHPDSCLSVYQRSINIESLPLTVHIETESIPEKTRSIDEVFLMATVPSPQLL